MTLLSGHNALPSGHSALPSGHNASPSGHALPPGHNASPSGHSALPPGYNALPSGHSLPSGHNALPSGHNAVDAGPLLIDLLDVKEEEVEECFHTLVDHTEVAWPYYKDLDVSLWHGNEVTAAGGVTECIQSLDSTLFQYNMRGWFGMQNHIRIHAVSFIFSR